MRTVELVMSGGAKDEHDMSNMMADGPLWQFNGVAIDEHDAHGMGAPLFTAKRGETIALRRSSISPPGRTPCTSMATTSR